MEIISINNQNIDKLKELYESFIKVAQNDYLFELPPITFPELKINLQQNYIKILLYQNPNPQGFLVYSDNLTEAVELTFIYAPFDSNTISLSLLKQFLIDASNKYKNKIISYPMLGIQNRLTQDITNLGFNLIGQAILEFNFYDKIQNEILIRSQTTEIQSPYSITNWQDSYFDTAAQIVLEEFSMLNDAKFDPRFSTLTGTKEVIECITKGYYGQFLPEATSVLKYENIPVGFCFCNLTTPQIANVPILCINSKHQHKSIAPTLLKNSLIAIKNSITKENTKILKINTTCDTSNFPAIKTYRKVGFKEKTYYSHAYLKF